MKAFAILLLSGAVGASAAISGVSVVRATNTQAILSYTAPSAAACALEVSESDTYSPLVHDVNPTLFTGADSDDRAGNHAVGRQRWFVVGKRAVDKASDSKRYSRALKAATLHYYQITCGGDTATGSFITANIPLGDTATDPYPAITEAGLEGYYNFASWDTLDRDQSVIDPQTGAEIRKYSAGTDAGWPDTSNGAETNYQTPMSCAGTNWAPADNCVTTYAAGLRDQLFARHNYNAYPTVEYQAHKVNVYLKATISGSPTGDDKYLDVCLTLNGSTCASDWKAVDLTTCNTVTYAGDCNGFGSDTNPAIFWDLWTTQEFPFFWNNPTQSASKQTGFLFKPRTTSSVYTINIAQMQYKRRLHTQWIIPASANVPLCNSHAIVEGGRNYYLCISFQKGRMHAVDTTTGQVYYQGLVFSYSSLAGSSWVWDATDPRVGYALSSASNRILYRLTFTSTPGVVGTNYSGSQTVDSPRLTPFSMTPTGYNLLDLLQTFDARYNATWKSRAGTINLSRVQAGNLALWIMAASPYGGQDAPAWVAIFDPSAAPPPGSGGAGNIVASVLAGGNGARPWRYSGTHGVMSVGLQATTEWVAIGSTNRYASSNWYFGGPWYVQAEKVGGGDITPSDTIFQIQLANESYEPTDDVPAGPDDATITAEVGDLFVWKGSGVMGTWYQTGDEVVELQSKDLVTHRWTVRRAGNLAASLNFSGLGIPITTDPFTTPKTFPAGSRLYGIPNHAVPNTWNWRYGVPLWNFVADPYGTGWQFPGILSAGSSILVARVNNGGHGTFNMSGRVQLSYDESPSIWGKKASLMVQPGDITQVLNTTPSWGIPIYPPFGGKVASGAANIGLDAYETHFGRIQYDDPDKEWGLDVLPLITKGTTNALVSGTTSVYKVLLGGSASYRLLRKHFATVGTCGDRVLRDISGPSSSSTDADLYTYCVAERAGECRAGSSAGDIYVNCPGRTLASCKSIPYSELQAYDAALSSVDICVYDREPRETGVVEDRTDMPGYFGENSRVAAWAFARPHVQSAYANAFATPDGKYAITAGTRHESYDMVLVRLPPFPPWTSQPGNTFERVKLSIASAPRGTDHVVVDFGYGERGAPSNYDCTSRAEDCVVTSATVNEANPFTWAGEVKSGVPCASGCSVEIPRLPGRVLYARIRYRASDGSVLRSEPLPPL